MSRKRIRGITLIELMIVVTIVGILAAVVYPSYSNYMRQTRRSDAQIALTKVAAAEEKFYTDCSTYAVTLAGTRSSPNPCTGGILGYKSAAPILSDAGHYVVSLVAVTASGFTLQATPATTAQGGTGQQVSNGNLRIDSTGAKTWAKDGVTYAFKWTDK